MHTDTEKSADALYGVGYWLLEQQRHADAKHVFRTMLLVVPSDERGWLGLGSCHERSGEHETAARLYGLARQACPKSLRAMVALGRVLRMLSRDVEAAEVYDVATELALEGDDRELATSLALEARTL